MADQQIGMEAILSLQNWSKNVTTYINDQGRMEKASEGFGSKVGKHFDGVGKAVLGVSAAIGAAAAGAGVAVGAFVAGGISKAADLEAAMSGIAAALNITAEEAKPLKDEIMSLALDPNLVVNTTEAAAAIENLAKNGLSMTEILDGAARSTVLLANATGADFGMAADIASDTMAIFNINAADMATAVDGITGVTNASKFTINDYKLALSQAGAVANMVGVEFDDFNTMIAATSQNFASGSDSGTAFKTMLMNLSPKSKEALGEMKGLGLVTFDTSKAMEYLKDKGVTPASDSLADIYDAMRDVFFTMNKDLIPNTEKGNEKFAEWANATAFMTNQFYDANGALKDSAEIAEILHEATKDLTEEQRKMAMETIFGSDAIRAATGMADAGAVKYRTAAEAAKDLGISIDEAAKFAEGGITHFEATELAIAKIDAEEQAATRMKNFRGVLMILQGAIEAVQIMIGDAFLPILTDLATKANELVSAYGPTLVKTFQDFAGGISATVKILGSFIMFGELLRAEEVGLTGATGALVDKFVDFTLAIYDIGKAVMGIIQPIVDLVSQFVSWKDVLIVAGIAAATVVIPAIVGIGAAIAPVVGTFVAATAATAALRTAWESDFLGIQTSTLAAADAIQTAFMPLTTAIQTHAQGALAEVQAFVTGNQTEFTNLQAIWEGAKSSAENVFGGITGFVQSNLPAWQATLTEWGNAAAAWIAEAAPKAVAAISQWVHNLTAGLSAQLPAWKSSFVGWTQAAWNWITEAGGQAATAIGQWLHDLTASLASQLPAWKSSFTGWITALSDWIAKAIPQIATKIGEWYTALTTQLDQRLPELRQSMLKFATVLVEWIGDKSADVLPELGEWLGKIVAWIPTGVDTMAAEMLKFATTLVTWIGDKSTDVLPELGKWLGKILAWIPLGVIGLAKGMIGMAGALIGWIAGGDGEAGGESAVSKVDPEMEKFQAALVDALGKVGKAFVEGVQAFVTEWRKTMSEYVDWNQVGSDIVTTIWNGVETMKALLTGTFQSIVTNMVAYFTNTDWGSLGQNAVNKIKSAVSSAASGLLSVMSKLVTDAAAKFTSFNWAGLGKNVIDGILKGLKSNGQAIVDYIFGLGQEALDKIKAFLGISSPSKEFMKVGYEIVRGWILGLENQATPLAQTVTRLGWAVAKAAGMAGANAANVFVDALTSFQNLGSARIDTVRSLFEEASDLAGKIAGLGELSPAAQAMAGQLFGPGGTGSMAYQMWAKRSSDLGRVIARFEQQSELLKEQQNIMEMVQTISNAGGDVQGMMGGFLVGNEIAVDAESQVKMSTKIMEMLNRKLKTSLMMSVKGFTQQAQKVQAAAEQALDGFGDAAKEKVAQLTEAMFSPDQDNQQGLAQLRQFATILTNIKTELSFMAKGRLGADSIIQAMTGEFSLLDDFKQRIAGYDEQIESLQDRILETGDSSLMAGLRRLDSYRSAVTQNLREFLVQNKRAEQALDGFGDTAKAEIDRILGAMFGDDVSFEERLGLTPMFENALQKLLRLRAIITNQSQVSVSDIIDRATAGFDQVKQFTTTIDDLDEEIGSLQEKIMETGDESLLSRLAGLSGQRAQNEAALRTFFVQTSRIEGAMRKIKTIGGAGETSATRFMEEQIQSIASAIAAPMREIDREMWVRTAEQRVDFLNRFIDQARVVEQLQQKASGIDIDSLTDEFAQLTDINVPEANRMNLMKTMQVFLNQMQLFRSVQKDLGDATAGPFAAMMQSNKLDPLIAKIEDLNTSEQERQVLIEQYRREQEKLLEVGRQQQYLGFLEEQANLLNSLKGLGGDTGQLARLSQIFQGITLGPNASTEDLLTAETRLMQERIRLTEEYLKRQQQVVAAQEKQQRIDFVGKQVAMVQQLIELEDEYGTGTVPLQSIFRGLTFGADMSIDQFMQLSNSLLDVLMKTGDIQLRGEGLHTVSSPLGNVAAASSNVAQGSMWARTVNVNIGPNTINNGMDLAMFEARVKQVVVGML